MLSPVQNTALDITLLKHLCWVSTGLQVIQKQVETNKYIISNKELLETLEARILVSIGELVLWMTSWAGLMKLLDQADKRSSRNGFTDCHILMDGTALVLQRVLAALIGTTKSRRFMTRRIDILLVGNCFCITHILVDYERAGKRCAKAKPLPSTTAEFSGIFDLVATFSRSGICCHIKIAPTQSTMK
jgi:hypothetical protein